MRRSSIRTDEENGIVSFTYSCGVLGGILFTPADELEEMTLDAGENGLRPPRGLAEASSCAEMPLTEDVREAAAARQNARAERRKTPCPTPSAALPFTTPLTTR